MVTAFWSFWPLLQGNHCRFQLHLRVALHFHIWCWSFGSLFWDQLLPEVWYTPRYVTVYVALLRVKTCRHLEKEICSGPLKGTAPRCIRQSWLMSHITRLQDISTLSFESGTSQTQNVLGLTPPIQVKCHLRSDCTVCVCVWQVRANTVLRVIKRFGECPVTDTQ
jgi:hypothetical protein